jgi:hypothetical protein
VTRDNPGCAAPSFIYYPNQQGGWDDAGKMPSNRCRAWRGRRMRNGCPVMDAGDGTYLISARASPARGGATGAQTVAYTDAQKFCAQKGDGSHPIVVNTQERDIYQSSFGGGSINMAEVSADPLWRRVR